MNKNLSSPGSTRFNLRSPILAITALCCTLSFVAPLHAQSVKSVKEREAAVKSGTEAKAAIMDSMDQFSKVLAGYNSILDGTAKNLEKAYKTLLSDTKNIEGKRNTSQKSMEKMDKQAKSFFASWEKELEVFNDPGMKEKAGSMLEDTRARYNTFVENMSAARELFVPVSNKLNDQILFLGRMLTPEGIASMQEDAAALNEEVAAAIEQAKKILGEAENVKPDDGSVPHPPEAAQED
jgi:hypothetical protein